ncbi:MAG: hypothetical protein H6707_02365 [Deltaproteobacteria bacterium]|nr:hypothetical protein [Deltaproteobacteria bacterium]
MRHLMMLATLCGLPLIAHADYSGVHLALQSTAGPFWSGVFNPASALHPQDAALSTGETSLGLTADLDAGYFVARSLAIGTRLSLIGDRSYGVLGPGLFTRWFVSARWSIDGSIGIPIVGAQPGQPAQAIYGFNSQLGVGISLVQHRSLHFGLRAAAYHRYLPERGPSSELHSFGLAVGIFGGFQREQ